MKCYSLFQKEKYLHFLEEAARGSFLHPCTLCDVSAELKYAVSLGMIPGFYTEHPVFGSTSELGPRDLFCWATSSRAGFTRITHWNRGAH